MVTKCANPACRANFRYLRQGRLFLIESATGLQSTAMVNVEVGHRSRRLQYFWLCDQCCQTMKVVGENGAAKLVWEAA